MTYLLPDPGWSPEVWEALAEAATPRPAPADPSAMRECSWCEEMTPAGVRQENEGMCLRCWKLWATTAQLKQRGFWNEADSH